MDARHGLAAILRDARFAGSSQADSIVAVVPGRVRQHASAEPITMTPWLWIPGSPLHGAPE
jgi:hypothetical protein